MDELFSSSPLIVRNYMNHLLGARGKFIRAYSLLACAQKADGDIDPNAVKVAAALEIFHLATLVHDDILDDSDTRRGIPTLQKKFGPKIAVICGDYLLCLALKLAASISNRDQYLNLDMPNYVQRVCFGELEEQINNGNWDLSIYRYLKIISGKTAALFEASFYGGAILSESKDEEIEKYKRLGRYIGMIFQLTDDCMDFEATQDMAKKPVKSDLKNSVITLPLIHALKTSEEFRNSFKEGAVTEDQANLAVLKLGGTKFTRSVAEKYYKKSVALIEEMEITEAKAAMLLLIVQRSLRSAT
jgi:heptaprenyl diphosphate synthase